MISIAIGTLVALSGAEWALGVYAARVQAQSMDPGLLRYHALRGWSLSPDWRGVHRHHDYEAVYSTDVRGLRNQTAAGAEGPLVTFLGDSFTFGLGVDDEETFVSVLNAESRAGARHVNHGVPGTSTDQQLLLLREALQREVPAEVVLVVYLPNDILDNTLDYPLQADQAKPVFVLENGRLSLRNTPVPLQPKPAALRSRTLASILLQGQETPPASGLLARFRLGRLLTGALEPDPGNELETTLENNLADALALFAALIDAFESELAARGSEFSLVLLPGREGILERGSISHRYQDFLRRRIVAMLSGKGIESLDLMGMLEQMEPAEASGLFFPHDGHLTPAGHQWVARRLDQAFLD